MKLTIAVLGLFLTTFGAQAAYLEQGSTRDSRNIRLTFARQEPTARVLEDSIPQLPGVEELKNMYIPKDERHFRLAKGDLALRLQVAPKSVELNISLQNAADTTTINSFRADQYGTYAFVAFTEPKGGALTELLAALLKGNAHGLKKYFSNGEGDYNQPNSAYLSLGHAGSERFLNCAPSYERRHTRCEFNVQLR